MGVYVASQLMKAMKQKSIQIKNSKILILGLTFKENCPDLRNSGVATVINELKKYDCNLDLLILGLIAKKHKVFMASHP